MAYIKYSDDPLKQRVSEAFSNLCASTTSGKKSLLAYDKQLCVFNNSNSEACFSLANFSFPVDTQNFINFEIRPGESLSLFDNDLSEISPVSLNPSYTGNFPIGPASEYIEPIGVYGASSEPAYYLLTDSKSYARGILLMVSFPDYHSNGDDLLIEDRKANLIISRMVNEDDSYTEKTSTIPIYSFFSDFVNPQTVDPTSLINNIVLENPSDVLASGGYCITITGLILYTKSTIDIKSCTC